MLKLDDNGSFVWVKLLTPSVVSQDVSVDDAGAVYISGEHFSFADFDPGPGTVTPTTEQGIFLLKLDQNGNFVWLQSFGSNAANLSAGLVTVDRISGDVAYLGSMSGTHNFGTGANTLVTLNQGTFILRFTGSGVLKWARGLDGAAISVGFAAPGNAFGSGIIDAFGNVITTGTTVPGGPNDLDPGPSVLDIGSAQGAAFVSVLNPNGDLRDARILGGNPIGVSGSFAATIGADVVATPDAKIFLHGSYRAPDTFIIEQNLALSPANIFSLFWAAKLDTDHNVLWTNFGGSGPQVGSVERPFRSLGSALSIARPGMTIRFEGGAAITSSLESAMVTMPLRLEAVNGPVTIGSTSN